MNLLNLCETAKDYNSILNVETAFDVYNKLKNKLLITRNTGSLPLNRRYFRVLRENAGVDRYYLIKWGTKEDKHWQFLNYLQFCQVYKINYHDKILEKFEPKKFRQPVWIGWGIISYVADIISGEVTYWMGNDKNHVLENIIYGDGNNEKNN